MHTAFSDRPSNDRDDSIYHQPTLLQLRKIAAFPSHLRGMA